MPRLPARTVWRTVRRGLESRPLEDFFRLLCARFLKQCAQLADRRVFFADHVDHIAESPQKVLQFLITPLVQRFLARPLQQRLDLFPVHFEHLVGGPHLKP